MSLGYADSPALLLAVGTAAALRAKPASMLRNS